MSAVSWSGVAAAAAHQLGRRAWKLALLGLAAGLLGAVVIGALATARRTATAYDRLADASALDDARATVIGPRPLADEVARLPGVAASWIGTMAVGRVEDGDGVTYLSVAAGPEPPAGLVTPVVVAGRVPALDDEIAVVESAASELGLDVGDRLRLGFLAPDEVARFDTGFGDPDGPTVDLRIVGLVRSAGRMSPAPILAAPAFAARYGDAVTVGHTVHLRAAAGTAFADLRAGVDRLIAGMTAAPGAEEFVPVQLEQPDAERAGVSATARVLVVGLLVLAAMLAAAGVLAVGQAFGRHHAARAGEQAVETALGLTPGERVGARLLAAAPAIAVAGVVAAAGGVVAGRVEPPGAMGRIEPHPGWTPNLAVVVVGSVTVVVAVTALVALAAWRAGRPRQARARDHGRPAAVAGRASRPAASAGIGLAVVPGGDPAPVPVRSTIVGVVLGVAGVLAVATFAASLDRLVATPVRWGWSADLMVVDASAAIVDQLAADPRVRDYSVVETATIRVGGEVVDAQAPLGGRGEQITWTALDGRAVPAGDDEIVLGSRLAERLGLATGDDVDVGDGRATVVGIGVGPSTNGEPLGDNVVLTPARLAADGESAAFREALVRLAPGVETALAVAALGARYELTVRQPPAEVANVGELGRLPEGLAALLGVVALAGLVHALASTVRRRSRELAIVRAIGFTPGQVAATVTVTAVTTAAIGLVAGVPLGLAAGRLGWWAVADAIGVAGDAVLPGWALLAVVVGAPVLATAAALGPARRAARLRPADLLTGE